MVEIALWSLALGVVMLTIGICGLGHRLNNTLERIRDLEARVFKDG